MALEGMGHKGMRAMSPLLAATANELRVKLGRGRDLPTEAKPKRPAKPKKTAAEGEAPPPAPARKKAAAKEGAEKPKKAAARTAKLELEPAPAEVIKPA